MQDAKQSDPKLMGWMRGFPATQDRVITFDNADHFKFPQLRWALSHMQELTPSVRVIKGNNQVYKFPVNFNEQIDSVTFKSLTGDSYTWASSLEANYTDGIIVLHKGKLVYEKYFAEYQPWLMHSLMSVTKSFVGLLATLLVYEKKLDVTKLVKEYLPELELSAFGDATVKQVMDMTTNLHYSENYSDHSAEIWQFAQAGNLLPQPKDYQGAQGFYEFLKTVKKAGPHGQGFTYKTVNTEVLAWIIQRITQQKLADLLAEKIWSKLGVEQDAMIQVDKQGTPFGGGGMNCGLSDLARFGEMMRLRGFFNGLQIVPEAVVDDIASGASQKDFETAGYPTLPGFSYHNMWWISHDEHGSYTARGIHGQVIWIDPKAEMVIARFGSHPMAANIYNDPISIPAYRALGRFFVSNT